MTRRKTGRRRRDILIKAGQAIRERQGEFDLNLTDIAEEVGCSTRQLQRVLTELEGEGFRSYLLRVRMETAHRLLSRRKQPSTVRKAARAVGYREASGLRQAFKRFYGYNPSDVQPAPPRYLGDVTEP